MDGWGEVIRTAIVGGILLLLVGGASLVWSLYNAGQGDTVVAGAVLISGEVLFLGGLLAHTIRKGLQDDGHP